MRFVLTCGALCALFFTAAEARTLKQDPPPGGLRPGESVFVDDGSCPIGQIKKVTGGSNRQYAKQGSENKRAGASRTVACVKR